MVAADRDVAIINTPSPEPRKLRWADMVDTPEAPDNQADWIQRISKQHTVTCDIKITPFLKQADVGVCTPKPPRPAVLIFTQEEGDIDEQEWERRAEMRSKAIAQCKALPEYQRFKDLKSSSKEKDEEPGTPNPMDRSISKRHWKFLLQQWRSEIQKCANEHAECNQV